jgi:hypothetical protein
MFDIIWMEGDYKKAFDMFCFKYYTHIGFLWMHIHWIQFFIWFGWGLLHGQDVTIHRHKVIQHTFRFSAREVHSLFYFAYTCVRDLFIGRGVVYLAKKIRWWYFTCKKPKNIICDGILHVNMFHYFKIPYFTCTFFTKFTYNEHIGPYFLSHVVLRFPPVNSPRFSIIFLELGHLFFWLIINMPQYITIFRSITMFYGIDNILQNVFHI